MQFHQRQLTRSTTLSLRTHGLHVAQRDGQGRLKLEAEMLYEELLPVQLEYRNVTPRRHLGWLIFSILYVSMHLAQPLLTTGAQPLSDEAWGWAFGTGLGLVLLILYAQRNWWHKVVLHTPRLQVILADHPADRQQLRTFVRSLQDRTKTYLRQEYGQVNPLGHIEPQLHRLAWLRELEVLSPREARALTTRLTGQVPAATLRSMGQELEDLFVN